jgi:DnaJ family protein C protein 27
MSSVAAAPALTDADAPAPPALRLRVVACGESLAGKSCLIKRFCEGKFVPRYIPTIGVDYGVKVADVAGARARVNFFDLSGVESHLEIRNEFYREAQAVRAPVAAPLCGKNRRC